MVWQKDYKLEEKSNNKTVRSTAANFSTRTFPCLQVKLRTHTLIGSVLQGGLLIVEFECKSLL